MTKKAMIKVLEYKADYIKTKIKPQFFREVAMVLKERKRTGHWEPTWYDSYVDGVPVWEGWKCSKCGYEHNGLEDTLTDYCPGCGADMRGGGRMSKRIAYEKQCMLCKWTDNTQAQCFCGHLQNMAGCQSFEPDDSKPKIEELKKTALKLNMLMCKARVSSIVLDSNYGVSLKASAGLPTEIYIIPSNEEII